MILVALMWGFFEWRALENRDFAVCCRVFRCIGLCYSWCKSYLPRQVKCSERCPVQEPGAECRNTDMTHMCSYIYHLYSSIHPHIHQCLQSPETERETENKQTPWASSICTIEMQNEQQFHQHSAICNITKIYYFWMNEWMIIIIIYD